MIPEEKIREVADRLSIVEVVGEYLALRRSGANYQGLCPFHGEKTPSFNVNPARNIYHCFGCGVGGNAFSFVMRMEGLTFPEAVKFLAKRTGITIEEQQSTPQQRQLQDEREQLLRVSELAAGYFRRLLLESSEGETARSYLAGRNVTAEGSEAYRLGYASDKWDGLLRYLERQHVSLSLVEKLGLIRRNSSGKYTDLFRNRLIFPICDNQGRPIAFGGRILGEGQPKYLNSPESPIYHKSDVLFGIHLARGAMREQGAAIVVEGYFDHLALWQGGLKHVVATCGTALTEGHVKLLRRSVGRLFTMFDGDAAGQKATLRVMDMILGSGLASSVVALPEGEDPDTFISIKGGDALNSCITSAKPIFEWYLQRLSQEIPTGSVEGKVALLDELAPRLQKMTDPVERGLYLREIARRFGIEERLIDRKIGKGPVTVGDFARTQKQKRPVESEDLLMALIGRFPYLARRVAETGVDKYFSSERQPMASALVSQLMEKDEIEWSAIFDLAATDDERNRLAEVLVDEGRFAGIDADKMFEELCVSRTRQGLKRIEELRRELAHVEAGSPQYRAILTEINTLRNTKSQLL